MAENVSDSESPLSVRLQVGPDSRALESESEGTRQALAESKVGSRLRGWRLVRLLGVGPVTAAYEAYRGQKDATEHAVVRLMIGTPGNDERARSLFLRASYAANRFDHSRVVHVKEDGTDEDGTPFVVRPWIDAEPLITVVLRESLEQVDVLRVAEQLLDIVEMAHAQGVLHGAIHPANVFLTSRGSVRLCDFATAPGLSPSRTDEDALAPLRVCPFMAPERRASVGLPPSEMSDIYSIGAVLWYAVAGVLPPANLHSSVERKIALPRGVNESFGAVLFHALREDPIERYESAYAFLGDVRRVMAGRRPKLADAGAPVPSQSMQEVSRLAAPSSRRVPSVRPVAPVSYPPKKAALPARSGKEWKGNLFLTAAIALLLGIATFVLFREKTLEERERMNRPPAPSPSASAR